MNVNWLEALRITDTLWLYPNSDHVALASLEWKITSDDSNAAWEYYIELRSRIATRSLPLKMGSEEGALDSIVLLFELFRGIAKRYPNADHFGEVTLQLLNRTVRPFTTRWHPARKSGRLNSGDHRIDFRIDLDLLRHRLQDFTLLLREIAGTTQAPLSYGSEPSAGQETQSFPPSMLGADSKAEWNMLDAEMAEIRRRRKIADNEPLLDVSGLALSGGGIRSATFALGFVTTMAQKGILASTDYLSTVSGGGFLGGFISSVFSGNSTSTSYEEVFGEAKKPETPSLRALRNGSRFILSADGQTRLALFFTIAFGLFVTGTLVAPLLCLSALGASLLSTNAVATAYLLVCVACLFFVSTFGLMSSKKAWFRAFFQRLAIVATLLLLNFALYFISSSTPQRIGWAIETILVISVIIATLFLRKTQRRQRLYISIWGVVCLVGLALSASFMLTLLEPLSWKVLSAVVSVAIVLSMLFNLNTASPHLFYGDRIRETFLLYANAAGTIESQSTQLLEMNDRAFAPYHLICATHNTPSSRDPDLRGRRSCSFVFSKHFCGSRLSGYYPTAEWEKGKGMRLETAIAISGAAASPNMGRSTVRGLSYLLALFNFRLGYWLKHPERSGSLNSYAYYFRELAQKFDESLPYLNVSDGGHLENLGALELLRRRCRFIVVVDGEADPLASFEGLLNLIQMARIDLSVRIEPDLSELRKDVDGIGRTHWEIFNVGYPEGFHGVMLYVKASLTGNESELIQGFRKLHPDFPHETTLNQSYSEQRFEAYRSLGEHIAEDLFRPSLVGHESVAPTMAVWLTALRARTALN